jgi:hypothetical protein
LHVRSRPLRMRRRTDCYGKLPLPRLPTRDGSAFAAAVLVPISAVNISGEVKYYEAIGDSGGIVRRGFCPNCGARLFGQSAASPGSISIMAGSLDDSSWYTPQADIYTASVQPWDYMNPDLPKFPGLPQNVSQGP